MKLSFIRLKCGLKVTGGDTETPKRLVQLFFFSGRKGINRWQIPKHRRLFKIKGRWTSKLGGNIANALLFKAKQESGVLMVILLHWLLKHIIFESSYRLYALLTWRGQPITGVTECRSECTFRSQTWKLCY